jgi:hypothetical protein
MDTKHITLAMVMAGDKGDIIIEKQVNHEELVKK